MMSYFYHRTQFVIALCLAAWVHHESLACTGITLKAKDGAVVYGRTMEWGSFDLRSRLVIVPRGYHFTGQTPDGKPGHSWKAKYGVVGLDGVEKDIVLDGMNEKGMTVGLFYHPGFAEYQSTNRPRPANRSHRPTWDSTCSRPASRLPNAGKPCSESASYRLSKGPWASSPASITS